MNKARFIAGVALFAVILGCGGTSGTSVLPNIYRGDWTGTWTSASAADGGPITLKVTADGSFTGTIDSKLDSGTFAGSIASDGTLTGVGSFDSGGNMIMSGATTLAGGHLTSNFSYTVAGVEYAGSFDATPVAAGG